MPNDTPVKAQKIHALSVPGGRYILFLVPGTNLVVLRTRYQDNSSYYGEAACWDTSSGEKMCAVQLKTKLYPATSQLHEPGRCSIALKSYGDYGDDESTNQ